jgi:hypothetical protein
MSRRWPPRRRHDPLDDIPDVRDGLTRRERVVLVTLHRLERELGRSVPTVMLYGRLSEVIDMDEDELNRILVRLGAGSRAGA